MFITYYFVCLWLNVLCVIDQNYCMRISEYSVCLWSDIFHSYLARRYILIFWISLALKCIYSVCLWLNIATIVYLVPRPLCVSSLCLCGCQLNSGRLLCRQQEEEDDGDNSEHDRGLLIQVFQATLASDSSRLWWSVCLEVPDTPALCFVCQIIMQIDWFAGNIALPLCENQLI